MSGGPVQRVFKQAYWDHVPIDAELREHMLDDRGDTWVLVGTRDGTDQAKPWFLANYEHVPMPVDLGEEVLVPAYEVGLTMTPEEMDAIDVSELDLERIATQIPEGGGEPVVAPWFTNLQAMIAENQAVREAEAREISRTIELGPAQDDEWWVPTDADGIMVDPVSTCTCIPGQGCDEEGDPGCAYCRNLDGERPCPADDDG